MNKTEWPTEPWSGYQAIGVFGPKEGYRELIPFYFMRRRGWADVFETTRILKQITRDREDMIQILKPEKVTWSGDGQAFYVFREDGALVVGGSLDLVIYADPESFLSDLRAQTSTAL